MFRKVNTFQNNESSLIKKKKKIDLYSLLREDFNIKKIRFTSLYKIFVLKIIINAFEYYNGLGVELYWTHKTPGIYMQK